MQRKGDGEDEDSNEEFANIPTEFNLDDTRKVSEELQEDLEESMSLEVGEEDKQNPAALFTECMNSQTRHVFFGSTIERESGKSGVGRISGTRKKNGPSENLRYHNTFFPGIMIENGYTGSLSGISQLEAYRTFTGNPTPMRKLKGLYAISGHGGSECVGAATFKFPCRDTVLEFDAPIVKDADFPINSRYYVTKTGFVSTAPIRRKTQYLLVMDRRRKLSGIFDIFGCDGGTKLNACSPRRSSEISIFDSVILEFGEWMTF